MPFTARKFLWPSHKPFQGVPGLRTRELSYLSYLSFLSIYLSIYLWNKRLAHAVVNFGEVQTSAVGKLECQSQRSSSHLRLRAKDQHHSLKTERQRKHVPPTQPFVLVNLQWIVEAPSFRRAVCSTGSIDLNVNLIQRPLHRHA